MRPQTFAHHSAASGAGSVLALCFLLLLTAACSNDAPSNAAVSEPVSAAAAPAALSPEQLGTLGAQIRREPARADELLAQHRLTRESFEQAIRDVTENADASRRYATAYKRASS